jgi:hypothetical protein
VAGVTTSKFHLSEELHEEVGQGGFEPLDVFGMESDGDSIDGLPPFNTMQGLTDQIDVNFS